MCQQCSRNTILCYAPPNPYSETSSWGWGVAQWHSPYLASARPRVPAPAEGKEKQASKLSTTIYGRKEAVVAFWAYVQGPLALVPRLSTSNFLIFNFSMPAFPQRDVPCNLACLSSKGTGGSRKDHALWHPSSGQRRSISLGDGVESA